LATEDPSTGSCSTAPGLSGLWLVGLLALRRRSQQTPASI
jgi:hypothetical protein